MPIDLYKIWNSVLILSAGMLFLLFVHPAHAEVYKCSGEKNKIAYSDAPCRAGSAQTVTNIQTTLEPRQNSPLLPDIVQPSVMHQLDNAVKSAIADENFIRADALALTSEQRGWINEARRDIARNMAAGRTEADLIAEQGSSDECRQAKISLEKEAGSSFRKTDVLAAKTSLMHVSCGLSDPAPSTAFADAYPYGAFLYNPYRYYSHRRPDYSHGPRPTHPIARTSYPRNRAAPSYSGKNGYGLIMRVGSR